MNKKTLSKTILSLTIIICMLCTTAFADQPVKKDESVYVTMSPEGEVKDMVVSDWLKCNDEVTEIKDNSILEDIVNVKGDEKPEKSGENLIWKTNGNDVFYQGKTDKELPLEVKIKYTLDGNEIKPDELGGKSGNVKIDLEIRNKDVHSVKIGNENKDIYTPFAAVVVFNFPKDRFKNVVVNRGEVASDGKNEVVTFVTLPGIKDSIDIKNDILDLDLDEDLQITAEAENFELGPVMILATPSIPNTKKIKEAKNFDELKDGVNELKDASDKLQDGSKELSDNMELFKENFDKLGTGTNDLKNGVSDLGSGVGKAKDGAFKLSGGLKQLSDGLSELGGGVFKYTKGVDEYKNGVKMFVDAISDMLKVGSNKLVGAAKEIANGAKELAQGSALLAQKTEELSDGMDKMGKGIKSIDDGQKQVVGGIDDSITNVEKLKNGKAQENEGVKNAIQGVDQLKAVVDNPELALNDGQKAAIKDALDKYKASLQPLTISGAQIEGGLAQLEDGMKNQLKPGAQQVSGGLSKLNEESQPAVEGSKALAAKTKELSQGIGKLAAGAEQFEKEVSSGANEAAAQIQGVKSQLDNGAKGLEEGAKQLNDGTKKLADNVPEAVKGSQDLSDGLSALYDGTGKLGEGVDKLQDGVSKLSDGAGKLADGSKQLKEGMEKFNSEGIDRMDSELSDNVGDIEELIDTKDELVKLSEDYSTFAGLGDDMDGSVKFIMKTDEIEGNGKKVVKEEQKGEQKTGFIEWLKGFFSKNK